MNEVNNEKNEVKRGNGNSRRIAITLVLIMILVITTAGGTYAYLAISATSNPNNITGTVATAGLSFSTGPSLVSPTGAYASKPVVPQYAYNNSTNVLQTAITAGCYDGNGNAVCRVYSFTIKNDSTATVTINGKIAFTSPPANLKWAPMTDSTTVAGITATDDTDIHAAQASDQEFTDGTNTVWTLGPTGGGNDTKTFYIVMWINEIGSTQNDSGTWYATLKFNSSNGQGVTSTITGA